MGRRELRQSRGYSVSRVVIPAPLCGHCSSQHVVMVRCERRIIDQASFAWRCRSCEHMTYIIVETRVKKNGRPDQPRINYAD